MNNEGQISAIRDAVAKQDSNRLADTVAEMACYCHENDMRGTFGAFDDALFDSIIQTIRDPEFQAMEGSWHLLALFEFNWGLLTENQKDKLTHEIEYSYKMFTDENSLFVMSELIGRFVGGEKAIASLRRLYLESSKANVKRYDDLAISFIPNGYYCIAKNSKNPTPLREKAMEELRRMTNDPSEFVRAEASELLLSLGGKRGT